MGAWAALLQVRHITSDSVEQKWAVAQGVGMLSAIGTWRYSQGIYRYDADLFAALAGAERVVAGFEDVAVVGDAVE
jgi:hypothetical protein